MSQPLKYSFQNDLQKCPVENRMITATYSTSYESTVVNTGEPAMDVKESESLQWM
jgi:hypothetical protein